MECTDTAQTHATMRVETLPRKPSWSAGSSLETLQNARDQYRRRLRKINDRKESLTRELRKMQAAEMADSQDLATVLSLIVDSNVQVP